MDYRDEDEQVLEPVSDQEEVSEETEEESYRPTRHEIIVDIMMGLILIMTIVFVVLSVMRLREVKALRASMEGQKIEEVKSESFDHILTKMQNLENCLKAYYLFDEDYDAMAEAVYKALLSSQGDPYTVYYSPEEYAKINQSTSGTYCGVGVTVGKDEETDCVKIVEVSKGGDAEKKGLLVGDLITEVNGTTVKGKTLSEATEDMKGEEGTNVQLTVYRPSTGKTWEVEVVRTKLALKKVVSEMLDEGIGYIYISEFDEVTASQFAEHLEALKKEGLAGLVIDIRNNPGGLLTSVTDILDSLLPEGILVYTEDKKGNRHDYKSDANCLDIPMAVLINEKSASASEIFAGALQDYDWATLVGTQSFGKGIVQILHKMGDGSAIKVTVSRYFTPKGNCIHGVGIRPDVELEYDKEAVEGLKDIEWYQDNQVKKAYDIVLKELT